MLRFSNRSALLFIALLFAAGPALACTLSGKTPADNVFGIDVLEPSDAASYPLLQELGARWIRTEFHWSLIEKAPGEYDWENYDKAVAAMAMMGIQIEGVITYIPSWITSEEEMQTRLAAFSEALARRYRPGGEFTASLKPGYGVTYWEAFNEPNLPGYGWLKKGMDDEKYIALYAGSLKSINRGIRNADPDAFILTGGFSPEGIAASQYIRELYKLGAKDCFDILALHPYGHLSEMKRITNDAHTIMNENRDRKKPVWFTEFGTQDDSEKEAMIREIFQRRGEWDAFFWFSLRDLKARGWNFGLTEYDYSRKIAFDAMKAELSLYNDQISGGSPAGLGAGSLPTGGGKAGSGTR